jgi:hypothetical protein
MRFTHRPPKYHMDNGVHVHDDFFFHSASILPGALLACGLDGLERLTLLPSPVCGDEVTRSPPLPVSLKAALDCLEHDEVRHEPSCAICFGIIHLYFHWVFNDINMRTRVGTAA